MYSTDLKTAPSIYRYASECQVATKKQITRLQRISVYRIKSPEYSCFRARPKTYLRIHPRFRRDLFVVPVNVRDNKNKYVPSYIPPTSSAYMKIICNTKRWMCFLTRQMFILNQLHACYTHDIMYIYVSENFDDLALNIHYSHVFSNFSRSHQNQLGCTRVNSAYHFCMSRIYTLPC